MDWTTILQTNALGLIGGVLVTLIGKSLLGKRAQFTYVVTHSPIGKMNNDFVFGNLRITWNDIEQERLYLSTIELKNASYRDVEDFTFRVYSTTANFLNEQTHILGTPNIVNQSDFYREQVRVPQGEEPSPAQFRIYFGQREYYVPMLNRGQTIQIQYLTNPTGQSSPFIYLDVRKAGVKVKQINPQPMVAGIPVKPASVTGLIVGIVALLTVTPFMTSVWLWGTITFIYGLFAQLIGAYLLKGYKRLRDLVSD